MRPLAAALASLALLAAGPVAAAPPQPGTALFLGVHLIDTSAEGQIGGVRADQTARVEMVEALVRDELIAHGFTVTEPAPEEIAGVADPGDCNGCDSRLAAAKGLDYAVSGQVQKVSNLILAFNLVIREAGTGRMVSGGSVDIRGNTDESWRRGMQYLLDNLIFREAP